jgi:hypothetical protein
MADSGGLIVVPICTPTLHFGTDMASSRRREWIGMDWHHIEQDMIDASKKESFKEIIAQLIRTRWDRDERMRQLGDEFYM